MTDHEFHELMRLEADLWERSRPMKEMYETMIGRWSEVSNRINREKLRRELLSEIQTVDRTVTKTQEQA